MSEVSVAVFVDCLPGKEVVVGGMVGFQAAEAWKRRLERAWAAVTLIARQLPCCSFFLLWSLLACQLGSGVRSSATNDSNGNCSRASPLIFHLLSCSCLDTM